jgi:hypothetical protein
VPLLYLLCDEMTRPGILFIRWLVGLHSANPVPSNIRRGPRQVDQKWVDFNYDHGTDLPDPFERAYANTPLQQGGYSHPGISIDRAFHFEKAPQLPYRGSH